MIYLVSRQKRLFEDPDFKELSIEDSIKMMSECNTIQFDTETSGRDAHINTVLCAQFGNKKKDFQIVVDTTTIDLTLYKEILETKLIVGQNLKFDLQFLYNYNIIPRKVYDTMVVEQLLYLGYPKEVKRYSLKAIAEERLGIDIDKTVRGEIIWRGLDTSVIKYAAGDVMYLEDIMWKQIDDCKKKNCIVGAKLECDFVPVIAYLEWCGIKLSIPKWKAKMADDEKGLTEAKEALDAFVVKTKSLSKYTYVEQQGDLFSGFDTTPHVNVNWSSSRQVVNIAKILGFNTTVQDKKTGDDKDSVLEKELKVQKGINDEFLDLYFKYQEKAKVCSTYGQGHIDCINPKTGRIHTTYRQLGAASGRMSCGSNQPNSDLAAFKKIPASQCKYPNMQQLPADEPTRSSFVAEDGNMFISCDYSALESRLGADIYQEKAMLEEFLHGGGDMHSLCAKMVFADELKDVEVKDVKKQRPDLRKKVKSVEFAKQFGGSAFAISGSLGCSIEEAQKFSNAYDTGFKGVTSYAKKGATAVRNLGYVLMCQVTGHKMYWWDHEEWKKRQKSFTMEFWQEYNERHKGKGTEVAKEVKMHFQAASKWDRMALNAPTQGTGVIILKDACIELFDYILKNNMFNKIKICALVHDEINCEYPKELESFPKTLETIMLNSAAKYCKSLPIPAEAAVADHWVH